MERFSAFAAVAIGCLIFLALGLVWPWMFILAI
ncbi:MAG: hypothetical protein ACI807_003528, partial [Paracoccaceae bacterium]